MRNAATEAGDAIAISRAVTPLETAGLVQMQLSYAHPDYLLSTGEARDLGIELLRAALEVAEA